MKTPKIRVVKFFLIVILILSYSCKDDKYTVGILEKAQKELENNPRLALLLLDSISQPETLNKSDYMDYIVLLVQAKIKNNQNISNDSVIYQAQDYFNKINKPNKAGLANYIAGRVSRAGKKDEEAMGAYLRAENYAKQTEDYSLLGKSLHSIGNLYFTQDKKDDAVIRYKDAFENYNKAKETGIPKLQVITQIGRSYDDMGKLDSALLYFNKGLSMAMEQKNQEYQTTFTHLVGMVLKDMGNYNTSVEYLHAALHQTASTEEYLRICLNLARLYSATNNLDSVKYYSTTVKDGLSHISDEYILLSMYKSLSDFQKQNENYKEALYYNELKEQANQNILEANNKQNLSNAENKYLLSLKDTELANIHKQTCIIVSSAILAFLLLVLIGLLIVRNIRLKSEKEIEKNKLLSAENKLLKHKVESLTLLKGIYGSIINEWTQVDLEVKELAREFGATDEPTIYKRISQIMNDLKEKSNQHLIERAKEYLQELGYSEAIPLLTDLELMIIILKHYKYKKNEIAMITGVPAVKSSLHPRKLEISRRLSEAGMPEELINEILFSRPCEL